eukprot:234805-Prymnesium_polylepis.1
MAQQDASRAARKKASAAPEADRGDRLGRLRCWGGRAGAGFWRWGDARRQSWRQRTAATWACLAHPSEH